MLTCATCHPAQAPDFTFTFFAVPAALVTIFLFGFARFDAVEQPSSTAPREASLLQNADAGVVGVGAVVVD